MWQGVKILLLQNDRNNCFLKVNMSDMDVLIEVVMIKMNNYF